MVLREKEIKYYSTLVIDLLLYLSFLFCYLSLSLPYYSIASLGGGGIIYGWLEPRIWGFIFPHSAFFFAFILQKNAPELLLRLYIFFELFFGLLFITVSPTISAQHLVGQSDLSMVSITLMRGAYLHLAAYILGAVASILQLILAVRSVENDRVGDHTFGINVTAPYQTNSTTVLGGYQSLADAPPAPSQPSHHIPSYPAPISTTSSYPPPTNPNANYASSSSTSYQGGQEEYKL